jgi:hypothetical protein
LVARYTLLRANPEGQVGESIEQKLFNADSLLSIGYWLSVSGQDGLE